ncbi:MAG: hypothetical protein CMK59_08365 [Proteobacteria bacterium]|nr:hypothetical protein [Pseudomonadota bacterium]
MSTSSYKKRLEQLLKNGWVQLGIFIFVIIHFTTLYIFFIAPQKDAQAKEDKMRSWAWSGEVLLSIAEECKKNPDEKLCGKADKKAYDYIQTCRTQIPEAIKEEGLEVERELYQEKKAFVLDLCGLLEKSEYAKDSESSSNKNNDAQ